MKTIEISSAYSAQPSIAKPNPFVSIAIKHIFDHGLVTEDVGGLRVADQGCGRLRHLAVLREFFDTIYLIDTEFQLNRRQRLFGLDKTNIKEYIANLETSGKKLIVLSSLDFDSSKLNLDIVFNICVLDVEIPKARKDMISATYKNLKEGGLYIVIIPRNDQSILIRCTAKNRYLNGHIFQHHGVTTFYKNYRDTKSLIQNLVSQDFALEADLSVYRQVCLILSKGGKANTT
jgi:SAM-dependent methyltransferase